jgi:hypothetical protein
MYDAWKVILGIIVFIALFTTPLWLNALRSVPEGAPKLVYPEGYDRCVKDKEYMKSFHMDMLNAWRDEVVREDNRFINVNGSRMEKSLTKTCMKCHSSKTDFCDKCHNYLGVSPYCWSCHVEPQEAKDFHQAESVAERSERLLPQSGSQGLVEPPAIKDVSGKEGK